MPRRLWTPLLKLSASVLLLVWVAWALDWTALARVLGGVDRQKLLLAILLLALQVLVIGWRWRRIVVRLGGRMRGIDAVRWVLVGQFFNGALPTSVGGDALRIMLLHRSGAGAHVAVQSVLIERVSGLVVLGLIVSLCAPTVWSATNSSPVTTLGLALALAGPVLALAVVAFVLIGRLGRAFLPTRAGAVLATALQSLRPFVRKPSLMAEIAGMACAASLIGLAAGHVLAQALGISTTFPATAALLGGAVILSLAPVSLGGWGVREAGMVALFGSIGVPAESALALSLLWGVLPLLISVPAFLVWRRHQPRPLASAGEPPYP